MTLWLFSWLLPLLSLVNASASSSLSHCVDCIPEDELPSPTSNFSLRAFAGLLYEHLLCAPIVWQWAMLYFCLWFAFQYAFSHFYYPWFVFQRYGITENSVKSHHSLNHQRRSPIAANKVVSFIAAVLTVVRCALYMHRANWDYDYLWNSIYIPGPRPVLDLLDSSLGYFVFDIVYLFVYHRQLSFIIHHLVVPVAILGVKSFGFGCQLGLPIFVTADVTTLLLNVVWFAEDHVKYINFAIDSGDGEHKSKLNLSASLSFWNTVKTVTQLLFGVSFLYLRLGQLSYLILPWLKTVVLAKHVSMAYKTIAVVGNLALLGTSYWWSIHVLKLLLNAFRKLVPQSSNLSQSQKQPQCIPHKIAVQNKQR
eukprot:CAMPEP_0202695772 /NCGR_PEP_ID=MMETSP1385-20130828/9277_1 /ASSEMBLY_ACC=CAM_ASM_000861 /TAXON_ID=933848 /ORGANISM="Elphidium margaritaceum" /LENGTH=365 /DNA_ID=CAMNT_0049351849 /DNA_START=38 /DNA_END=1135 /DNA_ORIENTATION=-